MLRSYCSKIHEPHGDLVKTIGPSQEDGHLINFAFAPAALSRVLDDSLGSQNQEEELRLAVKHYKPRYRSQPGDVTILACHANGFTKELYEPLWDALYECSQRESSRFRIRGIWIADVANQGDSGVLNEGKLGNEPSWHDTARDYLAMVNHFRHEMPRPLIGIGHSMGATIMLNVGLLHPRLLTTVIAIEPSLYASQAEMYTAGVPLITFRKDSWPSADAALRSLKKSPVMRNWHPRVLELYRDHCLRPIPTGDNEDPAQHATPVALRTSKHQEALTYARPVFPESRSSTPESAQIDRIQHTELVGVGRNTSSPLYRPEATSTYFQLPILRPSCLYVYASTSNFGSGKPESRKAKLAITGTGPGGSGGATDGRVKETVIEGSHWVPFEVPDKLAEKLCSWIDDEMVRWRDAEAREAAEWQSVPHEQRGAVSDDWKFWMQKMSGKKGPDSTNGTSSAKL